MAALIAAMAFMRRPKRAGSNALECEKQAGNKSDMAKRILIGSFSPFLLLTTGSGRPTSPESADGELCRAGVHAGHGRLVALLPQTTQQAEEICTFSH